MGAVEATTCVRYSGGAWAGEPTLVPRENPLTIYVNGREMATVLCTPVNMNFLVVGFLYSEGLIQSIKDVTTIRVCDDEQEADVRLAHQVSLPAPRVLTSGCGGAPAGRHAESPVSSDLTVSPALVQSLMKQLLETAGTHREYGGLHTSALGDESGLVAVAEDIGRHNTLDKIQGECLLRGIATRDRVLLSTGRMSSEMIGKAARMGVPVVVSRSATTDRAIALADKLGITAIGYARGERFTVYSHPQRVRAQEQGMACSHRR
ncbi:MAG: formate dehydrogenase accessory sulfurtransferase FdhD [Chloroflexi bacterium]|nr:formate dehydrogenase accessory sulfurtransferase FdhD [Chloroflexota bacterium]